MHTHHTPSSKYWPALPSVSAATRSTTASPCSLCCDASTENRLLSVSFWGYSVTNCGREVSKVGQNLMLGTCLVQSLITLSWSKTVTAVRSFKPTQVGREQQESSKNIGTTQTFYLLASANTQASTGQAHWGKWVQPFKLLHQKLFSPKTDHT